MVRERSSGPSEVERHMREAQVAARKGECGIVRKLSERVRSLDAGYHRRTFLADRAIAACVAAKK